MRHLPSSNYFEIARLDFHALASLVFGPIEYSFQTSMSKFTPLFDCWRSTIYDTRGDEYFLLAYPICNTV